MNDDQIAQLLDRYMNGTCTPEEISVIDKWYDRYKADPEYTASLTSAQREQLKQRMFSKITTHAGHQPDVAHSRSRNYPLIFKLGISVAAAATLLVFVHLFFSTRFVKLDDQTKDLRAAVPVELFNKGKSILKHVLPDKSVVWLSPSAHIKYPVTFTGNSRSIEMEGECFFEITKNPRKPFIINSEHIITKVWGTSFRVRDGKNVSAATVVVVTGKVSVLKRAINASPRGADRQLREIMLFPQQGVVYDSDKKTLLTDKKADMTTLKIWQHVDLSFDNTPLSEIVSVLNKKFDVHIIIADATLNKAVMNADLNDLNLPDILDVLQTSMNCVYEVKSREIILNTANKPIK